MTHIWIMLFACLFIGIGLTPHKPEAVWGHGVNPSPLIMRSGIHAVFLYYRGTKRLGELGDTCKHPKCKLLLILLLQMAGDIESNPGPENFGQKSRGGGAGGMKTRQSTLSFRDTEGTLLQRLEALEERVTVLEQEKQQLAVKLEGLENEKRRNNIIVYGMPEEEQENSEQSEEKVKELIKDKLNIEDEIGIERVHRIGRKKQARVPNQDSASTQEERPGDQQRKDETEEASANDIQPKPRPVIVRFVNCKDKDRVLAAGRENLIPQAGKIRVGEDYSLKVRNARKQLIPFLSKFREKYKKNERKVFLRRDKLIVGQDIFSFDEEKQDIVKETAFLQ